MTFLAPWYIPILAAAGTIPALLLLYFLKLKRREVEISSTLLWRQTLEDLRVNSPFQKLRNNLLLWLQLMILLLAILALAEPTRMGPITEVERSLVLLIDRSASMSAVEPNGRTRLDIAKSEAIRVVDAMNSRDRAMVIVFADRAAVLVPFTDDKNALRGAIRSVRPSDASGTLVEAMKLAEAHSTPIGESIGTETEVPRAEFIVFTDGRLADARKVAVRRGRMQVVRIGSTDDNVGIVALDVRRHYEQPERVIVLGRVRNFGATPVQTDVSLWVNGTLKNVQSVTLAPLAAAGRLGELTEPGLPEKGNEAGVAFEFLSGTAAEVELRVARSDALAVDNHAYAVVPPPRSMTVLLVTPGNRYLRDLVAAMPLGGYEVWSPDDYEQAPEAKLVDAGRCRFDVVILDGHSTARLPPGNYVFFGAVPLIDGVTAGPPVNKGVILDWDETHPILRHVALDAVDVFSWLDLHVDEPAIKLVEASNGPLLVLLRRPRRQYLICAFGFFDAARETLNTDWVFDESIVVFMHNALRYLTGTSRSGRHLSVAPGEPVTVAVASGTSGLIVHRPDGRQDQAVVHGDGLASYARTDRVGFYRFETGLPGQRLRAVNLLDAHESFIAPNTQMRIAAGRLHAGDLREIQPRPLWPWLLTVLLVVLFLEWGVYCRRIRV